MSQYLTFRDANLILEQIKAGEWTCEVKREYEWRTGKGVTYNLERNGIFLWVANGYSSLKLSDECSFGKTKIDIPYILKIYLWYFGVSQFVSGQIRQFNAKDRERDYQTLKSKLFTEK